MISICIPVLNQQEMTLECLASVRAHTQDYEIILVDNGSDPPFSPSYTWLDVTTIGGPNEYVPGVEGVGNIKIVRNKTNLGFPCAVNQAIQQLRAERERNGLAPLGILPEGSGQGLLGRRLPKKP